MRVRYRRCSFNRHIERIIEKKGDQIKRGVGNLNFSIVVIRVIDHFRITPLYWVFYRCFKTMLLQFSFLQAKKGVLREMCKWRIPKNRFILFSLNCQKCIQERAHPFLLRFMSFSLYCILFSYIKKKCTGRERTRASRVAGENSTTEPPVTTSSEVFFISYFLFSVSMKSNCHSFLSLNGVEHN